MGNEYLQIEPQKHTNEQGLKSYFTDDKLQYTFYFELSKQQTPTRVDVRLKANTLLEDALQEAIQKINELLAIQQLILLTDIAFYKVRLTGKNFHPKTDLPAMSLFQKICDLKVEEFAVQILDKQKAILNIQSKNEEKQKGNGEEQHVAKKLLKLEVKEENQLVKNVQTQKQT